MPQPTAQPVCTMPTPRPRYLSRITSPISTAPAAHSPPKPSPCRARSTKSCSKFWAKAHKKVKTEYHRIVICSMRTRPKRSASVPENHPPRDETSKVTVPIIPASPGERPHSAITVGITKLYICTSNASNAQPPRQPAIVRRSRAFRSRSQASMRPPSRLLSDTGIFPYQADLSQPARSVFGADFDVGAGRVLDWFETAIARVAPWHLSAGVLRDPALPHRPP